MCVMQAIALLAGCAATYSGPVDDAGIPVAADAGAAATCEPALCDAMCRDQPHGWCPPPEGGECVENDAGESFCSCDWAECSPPGPGSGVQGCGDSDCEPGCFCDPYGSFCDCGASTTSAAGEDGWSSTSGSTEDGTSSSSGGTEDGTSSSSGSGEDGSSGTSGSGDNSSESSTGFADPTDSVDG